MEELNVGTIGAKRQSWKTHNPRDLLKEVMEAHHGADRIAIYKLFRERLREDSEAEEYIETMIEYWFANNYYSLVGPPPRTPPNTTRSVAQSADKIRAAVKKKIKEGAKIALLEMMMPNGKPLKDCTGHECRELSGRVGDWLAEVARRVKARQLVADALTEADLQAIY